MARAFQIRGFQRAPAFQTEDPQSTGAGGFGGGQWRINEAYSSGGLSDEARALLDKIFSEQEEIVTQLSPIEQVERRLIMQRNYEALIIILSEV